MSFTEYPVWVAKHLGEGTRSERSAKRVVEESGGARVRKHTLTHPSVIKTH